jgi:hypothetical protein
VFAALEFAHLARCGSNARHVRIFGDSPIARLVIARRDRALDLYRS